MAGLTIKTRNLTPELTTKSKSFIKLEKLQITDCLIIQLITLKTHPDYFIVFFQLLSLRLENLNVVLTDYILSETFQLLLCFNY